MNFLELTDISKSFGQNIVLQDMNMAIREGEFVSILGPSGSGKSTLFHLIGGILLPDKGGIYVNKQQITGQKGYISYMPQAPSLFPWRTVIENVTLAQELKGQKDKEKGIEMLKKAGLAPFINSFPDELSGGMKQRVSFIRALLSSESLLCLDEPFGALDEFTRLEMQKWLLSIWEEYKRTILFITHNIDEALFLSDRILIFSQRPANIINEVKVPFSRPRNQELWFQPDFLRLKKEIYYLLQNQGENF
ncbi:ABC transporter ATP-binding protein [Niallia sp. NCCP-28]|uniref:ABC transporter ATP-binding protein n=1 Tax=Niallia sp. NCCP-28 TaxID=2934712 RepID=UPI002088874A|nr:ABC transporter ATP-binding protein [Niallia sp. NCCP-28]GKU82266.1 ABC transporter ATP-binding protein [Niallia sp. NCCP-28]